MRPRLRDWVSFFSEVGANDWRLAGTITLRSVEPKTAKPIHPDVATSTAKYLLNRLNKAVYRHRAKKQGATVSSMMVLGKNALGDVTHIHFTFGLPEGMGYPAFEALVSATVRSLYWCDKQLDLKPYRDHGWLNYVLAHGTENLIIDCCRKARS